VSTFDAVSDRTIEQLHRLAGEHVLRSNTLLALTAAQISRRSAPALGREGMARQSGHRTPEAMTTKLGGIPKQDAIRALRDGKLIHDTQTIDNAEQSGTDPVDSLTGEPVTVAEPWLTGVGRARTRGMSRECADAIRLGLGQPTLDVTEDTLRRAADRLCSEAERLGPDLLLLRARRLRDEFDAAGIGLREEERRQKRTLMIFRQKDGMSRLNWLMDTETAAVVGEVYDRATSPKRGGPRIADGPDGETAARIIDDARTPGQLASDTFAQLLVNGVAADSSLILGTSVPAVRILTTAPLPGQPASARPRGATTGTSSTPGTTDRTHQPQPQPQPQPADYLSRTSPAEQLYGPGWIEGQTEPVSADTIARLACTGSTSTITFDAAGNPIDVSAEQRLYNRRQRRGLAARDGGCMWTDSTGTTTCDRPPSWTEAHHVEQWNRDGGKTTIRNGILLASTTTSRCTTTVGKSTASARATGSSRRRPSNRTAHRVSSSPAVMRIGSSTLSSTALTMARRRMKLRPQPGQGWDLGPGL
jgi:hypothetical protein